MLALRQIFLSTFTPAHEDVSSFFPSGALSLHQEGAEALMGGCPYELLWLPETKTTKVI